MKKISAILFLFFASSLPVLAQVIWSADPHQSHQATDFFKRLDGGNYPKDYCVAKGDEEGVAPSSVSVTTDPTFGKVWAINKPKNRKRGELARSEGSAHSFSAKEGDDIYIAWQWKIDTADGAKIADEISVFQWKSEDPHHQNYPLNMEYDGDLTLNVFGADYTGKLAQSVRKAVLWRKAVKQGEWVSLVVRINVKKDDFGGLVQFWFNGVQQTLDNLATDQYKVKLAEDKKTAYHRTNDGASVYPKWGVYNKKSCSYDVNAYFHTMKIGKSLESVMPINK